MTHTVNPPADTARSAQTHGDSLSTGLSWKRTTSSLRPAAYAVVAIVLNFLTVMAFSYDYIAGPLA